MNAVYASLICVAGAILCLIIRQYRPELAAVTAIAAGTAALSICMEDLRKAAKAIKGITETAGMDMTYSGILLRACGIALVAEFAVQICQDAGESAMAGRIKLALRLALSVMASPMLIDVISQSVSLMPL